MFDDLPLEEEWKHGLKQLVVVTARIQLETVSLEDTEHVLVHDLGMDEEMVRIMIDDFHPQILRTADAIRESDSHRGVRRDRGR
jgi:hypothetical protein